MNRYFDRCVGTARSLSVLLAAFALLAPGGAHAVEVVIPDPALEAALRAALSIPSAPLRDTDLATLTSLVAWSSDITNLSGLEYCTGLTDIDLSFNQFSDLTPLSGLTNLDVLDLSFNQISDLTPLSGLTNLIYLNLTVNVVGDLTALSGLTNLSAVFLMSNAIIDVTPLSGLTNLAVLNLNGNLIGDVTALSGLSNLGTLSLAYNLVRDLSAFVNNPGLGARHLLNVGVNPLDPDVCAKQIPVLQARGVTVVFDPCTGEGEGEGEPVAYQTADRDQNNQISLSELLRVMQFYNSTGFHCETGTEDGYASGLGDQACPQYTADCNDFDWHIALNELLRLIQFYIFGSYHYCPAESTEDGFCLGL